MIKNFIAAFDSLNGCPPDNWLILGKGPSLARAPGLAIDDWAQIGLNHVLRSHELTVSHIIDIDVVADCAEKLSDNARYVVIPWHPHVNHAASQNSLDDFADEVQILGQLRDQGRLLTYDLASGARAGHRGDGPVVPVRYFSFEAVFNLLSICGVKHMRTLGVDGGNQYSQAFDDLADKTLLANGHASFDIQFEQVEAQALRHGSSHVPLDVEEPVRVYVAATEDQRLSVKVLEHSIRRHCSLNVEVHRLDQMGIDIPTPEDPANRARTPFSFQRFIIPEAAGFTGKAIYLDSDMLVFHDIAMLWSKRTGGAAICAVGEPEDASRAPQFSVMLMDCAQLEWRIDAIIQGLDDGTYDYPTLMVTMCVAPTVSASIHPRWNALERHEPGQTALLHFTDMPTQPWVSTENANGRVWVRELLHAIASGAISLAEVADDVKEKFVRPSLLAQIEAGLEDPLLLPSTMRKLDDEFVAPYQRMPIYGGDPNHRPGKRRRSWALRSLAWRRRLLGQ